MARRSAKRGRIGVLDRGQCGTHLTPDGDGNLIDEEGCYNRTVWVSAPQTAQDPEIQLKLENKNIEAQANGQIIAVEKQEGDPSFASASFSNSIQFNGKDKDGLPVVINKGIDFKNLQTPLFTCLKGSLAKRGVSPDNFRIAGGATVMIQFKPNQGNGTGYKWVQCEKSYTINYGVNLTDEGWDVEHGSKGEKGLDYPLQSWENGVLTLNDTPSYGSDMGVQALKSEGAMRMVPRKRPTGDTRI